MRLGLRWAADEQKTRMANDAIKVRACHRSMGQSARRVHGSSDTRLESDTGRFIDLHRGLRPIDVYLDARPLVVRGANV
jgi:hypothetical protein